MYCCRWQNRRPECPRRRARWCNYFTSQNIRFLVLPNGYTGYVPSPTTLPARTITTANALSQTLSAGQNFALGFVVARQGNGLYYDPVTSAIMTTAAGRYTVNYAFDVTSSQGGVFSTMIEGMPSTLTYHTVAANVPYRVTGGASLLMSQGGVIRLNLASALPGGSVTASNLVLSVSGRAMY